MTQTFNTTHGVVGQQQRLTEMLMAISLATDLVAGQPMGQTLRASFLSVFLARELGCTPDETRSVLQVALLYFLGCTADSAEIAALTGGNEQAFNAAMAPVLMGSSRELVTALVRTVGVGHPLPSRLRMLARVLTDPGGAERSLASHCEVAAMLARRLGLGNAVLESLSHAYERWDGKGYPAGLRGASIPLGARIALVACDGDLFDRFGEDPAERLRARASHAYDPMIVDAFTRIGPATLAAYDAADGWKAVLECEPTPHAMIPSSRMEQMLGVLADFVDLKSPWTRGHSHTVAELADAAGAAIGLDSGHRCALRHAGLVHDVGRVGVVNGIWDKPGPLTTEEWERVRLHPYLTHRVLSRCSTLADLADLASAHHERLDGSGYHRGFHAEHLAMPARILAAADVFAATTSDRPHRPSMTQSEAAELLEAEARAGRLDVDAVASVLSAAGVKRSGSPSRWPAELTEREVEVLRLIARGLTNRQVAERLSISPKTVGRHVEHIYLKAGVSTRAGAAVFAMEHRLLD
jgi:HD-GYP domain-containing protein (c-di-GMP phosphodiesterase class II)